MKKKATGKSVKRSRSAKRKRSTAAKKKAAKKSSAGSRSSSRTKRKASSPSTSTKSKSSSPEESTTPATQQTQPLTPPAWLEEKPIALSKWHELAKELRRRRLLATIDLDLFALYCDAWQSLSDADAAIQEAGTYFETQKGYIGIHPAKLARDKAIALIQSLGDRIGIGINKRKGLAGLVDPERDPDDTDGDEVAAYAKTKPRGGSKR